MSPRAVKDGVERGVAAGGVQSVERAFALLERIADAGGAATLTDLSAWTGMPLPTIHRIVRTLVKGGYMRQEPSRRYALGPRLIRLGDSSTKLLGLWARPQLATLVDALGETANLALLEGDRVVYVAQVPSRHSMRMFTEPGRSVMPHCTGVGKALLSQLPPEQARMLLARTGMPARTPTTIIDADAMMRELDAIRVQGYSIDEGEQELGVRCVAVPVLHGPPLAAISVSGPEGRLTQEVVRKAVPLLREAATTLATDVTGVTGSAATR